MSYISDELQAEIFHEWFISGCSVKNKSVLYFCLRKELPEEKIGLLWDHEIPSKLLAIYVKNNFQTKKTDNIFSSVEVDGLYKPKVGITFFPREQVLLASSTLDQDGSVLVRGSDGGSVECIDKGNAPGIQNIKCINGYAYAVGLRRAIYKRPEIGYWVKLDAGFPEDDMESDQGFVDLDAFNEQDIYAVGNSGDIWHYNGSIWTQCGFPSNETLSSVVCAPDGQVYVGGMGGNLWVGRQHSWRCVYQGDSALEWNEMRWFQDQLWLCSDYELKVWNGKQMTIPVHNGEELDLFGHIDARDGVLLVASAYSVDLFDGTEWHVIV
ncbi:hypothetical protein [Serratia microhaemolytica]|uniref:hypothetical protein n=1 Tax=Serratia microhaemolytica TaxID=2675110 RepID=UPI000FDEC580|nr:hypothetical protein [Serratia microhaemolytica]